MTLYTHIDMPGTFGDAAFTLPDGRQFPRVWWRTSSPQEKSGLGFRVYEPPEPEPVEPPVPFQVTRRQILTALGRLGWITEAEAKAALATGAMPAVVEAVIGQMPEEHRFDAEMKWIGFAHAYRNDALVLALATATERDDEDIDALFTLAASID